MDTEKTNTRSSPLELMAGALALIKERSYVAEDLALELGTTGPTLLIHLRVLYRYGHVRVAGLVGKLGHQKAIWGIKEHPEHHDVPMANYLKARIFKKPELYSGKKHDNKSPRKTPRRVLPKACPVKLERGNERKVLKPRSEQKKKVHVKPAISVFDLAAFHQRRKEAA